MKDTQERIKDYRQAIKDLQTANIPKGFCYVLKPLSDYPEILCQKPFYVKERSIAVGNDFFITYNNPISKYTLFWFSPYWYKLRILMLRIAIVKAKRKLRKDNGNN